jgi:hypothetical protein
LPSCLTLPVTSSCRERARRTTCASLLNPVSQAAGHPPMRGACATAFKRVFRPVGVCLPAPNGRRVRARPACEFTCTHAIAAQRSPGRNRAEYARTPEQVGRVPAAPFRRTRNAGCTVAMWSSPAALAPSYVQPSLILPLNAHTHRPRAQSQTRRVSICRIACDLPRLWHRRSGIPLSGRAPRPAPVVRAMMRDPIRAGPHRRARRTIRGDGKRRPPVSGTGTSYAGVSCRCVLT